MGGWVDGWPDGGWMDGLMVGGWCDGGWMDGLMVGGWCAWWVDGWPDGWVGVPGPDEWCRRSRRVRCSIRARLRRTMRSRRRSPETWLRTARAALHQPTPLHRPSGKAKAVRGCSAPCCCAQCVRRVEGENGSEQAHQSRQVRKEQIPTIV
jgi:hypothetical protein